MPIENRSTHLQFIKIQWVNLAALAWMGYSSEGRGFVVVDARLSSDATHDQRGGQTVSYYLSMKNPQGLQPTITDERALKMVQHYNPIFQVVFLCIHRDGSGHSAYRVEKQPRPPIAYAEQINRIRQLDHGLAGQPITPPDDPERES